MRFYLSPHLWHTALLDEAEAHHAQRVLRLQRGAAITVFDGEGREASAVIETFHKKNASLRLGALQQTPRPTVEITLAQAIPKGRNMDLIIQKAVELGVTRIIPLVTDRTIVRCQDDETKQERWQAIALEACKQCGQNWMPLVEAPCSLQESLDFFQNSTSDANCDVAPVLASSSINYTLSRCAPETPGTWPRSLPDCSPSGLSDERHLASSQEARLSPEASFERSLFKKINSNDLLLIASLEKETVPMKNIFSSLKKNSSPPISSATIFIGPEGDFTPEEYLLARAAGCQAISLGPIVLRTETAALYCLSVLAYELLR